MGDGRQANRDGVSGRVAQHSFVLRERQGGRSHRPLDHHTERVELIREELLNGALVQSGLAWISAQHPSSSTP
jgi:hypothetical protein